MNTPPTRALRVALLVGVLFASAAHAATNSIAAPGQGLPDVGGSVVRMLGGLAFVFALFFGGVWVFRNWQRVTRTRTQSRLNIFETRAIGPRQALYVVGYDQQRFLVAASPAGVSLVSALPDASANLLAAEPEPNGATPFAQVLHNVLGRK
jgi:flagellar biogenesis protein FliO